MIYTFTLHSKQVTHEWNNMISQLEKVYKIRHQDFIFPNTIESIVDILTKHYKS